MQTRLAQLKNLISDFDTDGQQSTPKSPKIQMIQKATDMQEAITTTSDQFNLLKNEYRNSLLAIERSKIEKLNMNSDDDYQQQHIPISQLMAKSALGIRKEFEQIKEDCEELDGHDDRNG